MSRRDAPGAKAVFSAVGTAPRTRLAAPLLLAGGFVMLVGICVLAAFLAVAAQRAALAARMESQVSSTAVQLRFSLMLAESAQRGGLLTGRADYASPFTAAAAATAAAADALIGETTATPARRVAAERLRGEVTAKLAEMRRTLEVAAAGDRDGALRMVVTGEGARLRDAILADLETLRSGVERSRNAALDRQTREAGRLLSVIGVAALAAMVLAGLALRQGRAQLQLLARRERQLDRLVGSLEARVAERTRDLEAANQRMAVVLEASGITVFTQDRSLTYIWTNLGIPGMPAERVPGLRDADFMPAQAVPLLERLKTHVVETGETTRNEVRIRYPEQQRWYDLTLVPTRGVRGEVTGLMGVAVDITERREYEARIRLLMRELTHRCKNLLAVAQGIMRQTAASTPDTASFVERFGARLSGLSGSLDLLVEQDWRGTSMRELVMAQLFPFTDAQRGQMQADGPDVKLTPNMAQNIGMALHELAMNAVKFGALSAAAGRVRVEWRVEDAPDDAPGAARRQCRLVWRESGGPTVVVPVQRGFGQVVIERAAPRAVGGVAQLSYHETGLEWVLVFPLALEEEETPAA